MTRIVYHVAGSWSEPQITVLERENGNTSRGPAVTGEETGTGPVPPQEPLPAPVTGPQQELPQESQPELEPDPDPEPETSPEPQPGLSP